MVLAMFAAAAMLASLGCPKSSPPANPQNKLADASWPPASQSGPQSSPQLEETKPVQPKPVEDTAAEPPKDVLPSAAQENPAVENDPPNTAEPEAEHADADEFEPLFVDWPKPKFALFFTGRQHGYIEPCGCTGLTNQKGGLARRHTLLRQLRKKGWDVLTFDVGNQVRRSGRQAEIKFQMTFSGLKQMDYQAVGFGPDDLRLSFNEMVAVVADGASGGVPLVSANVNVLGLHPRFRILTAGGVKIGVTSVLGKTKQRGVNAAEVELSAPAEALKKVLPEMKQEGLDHAILLAFTSTDEARELARQFPEFDLIVTAGADGEPTRLPETVDGSSTQIIQTGVKGMYVGVVGFYDDPQQLIRYQRTPLDHRFADSAEMLQLLAAYQEQLKTLGLKGLGLKPVRNPDGRYVGSETCGECHTSAYEVWKNSPHATATESLVHPPERGDIPRQFDPECLSCHVTGWNAQGHFPYESGYLDLAADEHLHGNGCENCHSPGADHAAAEEGEGDLSDDQIDALRANMRLSLEQAESSCMDCHDLDNSPDFHVRGAFQKYWKEIEHEGLD